MRFSGQVQKSGSWWAIEVPLLGAYSQAKTKREAYRMIKAAIEDLVDRPKFSVNVYAGKSGRFEVGSSDNATLVAFFLRQQRGQSGQTLHQVARKLGQKSANAYARYEQGTSIPTVDKLSQLLRALGSSADFVLQKSSSELPLKL